MNKTDSIKELAKAVVKVMSEVKGMEKNSKVGEGRHSYDGTKDQDVKEAFNEALTKSGLCILPIGIDESTEVSRWEEESTWNGKTSLKQKQSVFTKVKTKYLLIHAESGQSLEIVGYGHGVDSQDKGAGKATTYALKNALLYSFLTPVGKIDDTDTKHSQDIEPPKKRKQTLVRNSENWKKCVTALKNGFSIDDLSKKYQITSEIQTLLINESEKL